MVKFSTDGAVLSNKRNAVQGTVKIIDVDDNGRPLQLTQLPEYLQKEITMYYYIGKLLSLSLKILYQVRITDNCPFTLTLCKLFGHNVVFFRTLCQAFLQLGEWGSGGTA